MKLFGAEVLVSAMEAHLNGYGIKMEFPLYASQFNNFTTMEAQEALTEVCRRRNLNACFSHGGIKFEFC